MSIKKAVILAGGLGTRLSEETSLRPKPMVQIGSNPILWHIMKIYSAYGIDEFVICLGYKGYMIKEYFATYILHISDVVFDIANNEMEVLQQSAEPWKINNRTIQRGFKPRYFIGARNIALETTKAFLAGLTLSQKH